MSLNFNLKSPLRWAGGKASLIPQLELLFPYTRQDYIVRYIECFVGGGAMLWHLLQNFNIRDAYISDLNPHLVLTYRVIKEDPESLIKLLENYQAYYPNLNKEQQKPYYYKARDLFNQQKKSSYGVLDQDALNVAALFIFLNKTNFQGLYRENSKGEYNVPIGDIKKIAIYDPQNIRNLAKAMERVVVNCFDYHRIQRLVRQKSFVYLDPPYRPLPDKASFTQYQASGFNDNDQAELAQFYRELDLSNAKLMLSNSDTKDGYFENLYAGFNINRVLTKRSINSKKEGRGKNIPELVITNFEPAIPS